MLLVAIETKFKLVSLMEGCGVNLFLIGCIELILLRTRFVTTSDLFWKLSSLGLKEVFMLFKCLLHYSIGGVVAAVNINTCQNTK